MLFYIQYDIQYASYPSFIVFDKQLLFIFVSDFSTLFYIIIINNRNNHYLQFILDILSVKRAKTVVVTSIATH